MAEVLTAISVYGWPPLTHVSQRPAHERHEHVTRAAIRRPVGGGEPALHSGPRKESRGSFPSDETEAQEVR